ncbi:MAG: hypothetical protein GC160_29250 [Acidobacteria bacterium]|nr:hypothetical protein [Acidobacteriota bacterium]
MPKVADRPTKFRQVPVEPAAGDRSTQPERLVSLDAFRGFIMTALAAHGFGLRTLADDPNLGWLGRQFEHVPWEGMVFWDLIQPAFMFMVGLAMPYAFRARERRYGPGAVLPHVAWRALMLILISQIIMSISGGELEFQLINVLAQIGFTYFLCYLILQLPFRGQVAAAALILAGHTALFHLFPGSDGAWSQADNVGARIDRFFGLQYSGYYVTINFISSTVTTLAGAWCGALMLEKASHARRMKTLAVAAAASSAGGYLLSLLNPMVKRLWTASFTLASLGCVIFLLLGFYWLVEVRGMRKLTFPLVVVGMNSIFIYCLNILLWGWFDRAVGVFTGGFEAFGAAAPILQATAVFAALWWVCYWLYQRKIFLKV